MLNKKGNTILDRLIINTLRNLVLGGLGSIKAWEIARVKLSALAK